jgi:arsenate reductase
MAEGFARVLGKGLLKPYSAGIYPVGVNPNAIRVMAEVGIDISGQTSDSVDAEFLHQMDVVITLCGSARAMCPWIPPEIRRIHWPIDDPVGTIGPEEKILREFRKTRDEIKERILAFIKEVSKYRQPGEMSP